MGLESLTFSEAKKLSKRASRVDLIDSFTGPLSSLCMYSGSDYLMQLGASISAAELLFLKLPFVVSYVAKTGDYKGAFFIGVKELVSNVTKIGGFIDIVPAYMFRTNYVLRNKL